MSARDELLNYADRYGYTEHVNTLLNAFAAEVLRKVADDLASEVPPLAAGPRTEFERGLMTAVVALRARAQGGGL